MGRGEGEDEMGRGRRKETRRGVGSRVGGGGKEEGREGRRRVEEEEEVRRGGWEGGEGRRG